MPTKFSARTVDHLQTLERTYSPIEALEYSTRNIFSLMSKSVGKEDLDLSTFRLVVEPNQETGMMEFFIEVYTK